jgi:hypothetical protein
MQGEVEDMGTRLEAGLTTVLASAKKAELQ